MAEKTEAIILALDEGVVEESELFFSGGKDVWQKFWEKTLAIDQKEPEAARQGAILFLMRSTKDNLAFLMVFFSELCWGKAMVACAMPQQRKKEKSKRLRAERDQIKFIDVGYERWQVVRFRKARGRQDVP